VFGALHTSQSPDILGRYSEPYAVILAALTLLLAVLVTALWRAPPRLVGFLTNAYLAIETLALSLLVVEIALRAINPWGMDFSHWLPYHMQGMISEPELGYMHPRSISYRLGANRVTLNAHGLRDREVAYGKPAGEKRILLLGDSVTFGWGGSDGETFGDRMEPLLAAATGGSWEVINSGVNGYNTQQEEAYLRTRGIRYEPDIVILTFVSNDVDPAIRPNETTWRRYPSWPESLPDAFQRLKGLSYTYQATAMFLRARQLHGFRTGEVAPESAPLTAAGGWPASKESLARIAALCTARSARSMVAAFGIKYPAFYSQLDAMGIAVFPLDRALASVPAAEAYVSAVDPHPTPAVHKAIAAALVDELGRRGMLE
jgi:hypothetical protein